MYIDFDKIKEQLNTVYLGQNIVVLSTVDSTNSYLKKVENPSDGTVVIAETQTGGRGRRGRNFWSPKGGIYMSLLYKPTEDFNPGKITSCVAVAVCNAIEKLTDLEAEIKWVNDVFVNKRKVCGILCEAITNPSTSKIDGIVIGIGVNVEDVAVPEELKNILTCLDVECGKKVSKNNLIAEILNNIETQFKLQDSPGFIVELRNRSCVLGKTVRVITSTESYNAYAEDIDKDCRLVVKRGEMIVSLSSGEISIRNI